MSNEYPFREIENRWQNYWDRNKTFSIKEDFSKPKYYVLDMFPYPSGAGLHVGHPEGYIATDIIARYKRMQGYNVLHPMGWDAFGLPAENYAIETGIHPRITTERNIATFKKQIKMLGFSYDWDREINTTDPGYYKWTQWIFKQLYLQGLAYQQEVLVNWCPALSTVLANEEVINGKSERGGHPVYRVPMRQWMLKITAYADRLLEDLEELDWPENIKEMQRNWIGRSEGANIYFPIVGSDKRLKVFTTRPDTLFGATYMVVSPEHPILKEIVTSERESEVEEYQKSASLKSDLDRTDLSKEKTGIFTGAYAINPVTKKEIPIWVSDYVLMGYGTGAIMAVPGHDQRDWEFARKFNLPIVEVIQGGNIEKEAYVGDGVLVNSDFLNGLRVKEAIKRITEWLKENELGEFAVNYKLRDWVFSRQRYWGEPFPIIFHEDGEIRLLDDDELPLELPEVEKYKPSGTGESPLATIKEWVDFIDPKTGKRSRHETHTMPQWAGSCWYYLRYIDPRNEKEPWNKDKENYWMPVDLYVGGAEHAVLHLLYARFWHKVLYDLGYVSTKEPFLKLVNQGMILGEDNEKMSKSRGNVVNPDEIVEKYGADSFRMYEMFMGPLEKTKPWSTQGLEGINRFLNRIWRLYISEDGSVNEKIQDLKADDGTMRLLHKTIHKITNDIENLRFNTAISQMMIFINEAYNLEVLPRSVMESFVLLISPFVPHLAEELWHRLGHSESLAFHRWPDVIPEYIQELMVTIAIQVNGKVRGQMNIERGTDKETVLKLAREVKNVSRYLQNKQLIKEIYVPDKLVSFVVR